MDELLERCLQDAADPEWLRDRERPIGEFLLRRDQLDGHVLGGNRIQCECSLETRDACPRDDDLHSTVTHRFDSLTLVDPIVTPRRRRGNRDRPTVRG